MNMQNRKKVFYYLAGVCFVIGVICHLEDCIQWNINIGASIYEIFLLTGYAIIALSMFTQIPIVAAIGTGTLIFNQVRYIVLISGGKLKFHNSWHVEITVLLVVYILIFVASLCRKKGGIFVFVAGALYVLYFLEGHSYNGRYGIELFASFSLGYVLWMQIAEDVFFIIGIFFYGLALSVKKRSKANEVTCNSVIAAPVENQIERITKLKTLLDAGIITQDEFDVKKEEILGL